MSTFTEYDRFEMVYASGQEAFAAVADREWLEEARDWTNQVDYVETLQEMRDAFEAQRTDALERFPELEGPVIADALYEAAAAAWGHASRDF